TPEHILRCGRVPLVVEGELLGDSSVAARAITSAFERFATDYRATFARHARDANMLDPVPRVVILPGLGLVTAMKDKAGALVGNACYRHVIRVMHAAESLGGFRFLDESHAFEFEYWPLELAKLQQPKRKLSRKVALVTKAANGIDRAITERLTA